jgi:two-component system sensor histidine kinase KdpD
MDQRLDGRPLELELAPDLPLVSANAVLIEQVFTNLLENALKYSAPVAPLRVWVRRADDPSQQGAVIVGVRDQGTGVPAQELERIFDKFYRSPGRAGQASGAGLGLAICKGIVEAHGGRIWAENNADGGATFAFTLPHTTLSPEAQANGV